MCSVVTIIFFARGRYILRHFCSLAEPSCRMVCYLVNTLFQHWRYGNFNKLSSFESMASASVWFTSFIFVIQKDDNANATSTTTAVSFLADHLCSGYQLCTFRLLNCSMGFINAMRFSKPEVFEQTLDCQHINCVVLSQTLTSILQVFYLFSETLCCSCLIFSYRLHFLKFFTLLVIVVHLI